MRMYALVLVQQHCFYLCIIHTVCIMQGEIFRLTEGCKVCTTVCSGK